MTWGRPPPPSPLQLSLRPRDAQLNTSIATRRHSLGRVYREAVNWQERDLRIRLSLRTGLASGQGYKRRLTSTLDVSIYQLTRRTGPEALMKAVSMVKDSGQQSSLIIFLTDALSVLQ